MREKARVLTTRERTKALKDYLQLPSDQPNPLTPLWFSSPLSSFGDFLPLVNRREWHKSTQYWIRRNNFQASQAAHSTLLKWREFFFLNPQNLLFLFLISSNSPPACWLYSKEKPLTPFDVCLLLCQSSNTKEGEGHASETPLQDGQSAPKLPSALRGPWSCHSHEP